MRPVKLMLATATLLCAQSLTANELATSVKADYDQYLGALFEHFHRNPELSTIETETAARMAQELRSAGFDVAEGVGGTGLVALLENGDGPLVMMRADMDGLPVQEEGFLLIQRNKIFNSLTSLIATF